ncbi:fatty acid desaturase [Parasulfuritortus cantonensis]|uniref:Fatty acid desaturase n=1 Tax=Parasulfuritortus cantonensis TaxID=2528202 RepID=A0A4R1BMK2_9PROT|nr:fatty acid desaturase [Parasulfuritortus cantonensis]TCJ18576.1 fatty acid desaturase [Parasulfuritortus cantonensis]
MPKPLFRAPDGALPNLLALAYVGAGYVGGLWLMAGAALPIALAATLWFAHALIIAAYLFHEFAHNTVFASPVLNRRGGLLMTWLTGSCYARYEHLRFKHMRHHVDRADVISLDVQAWLQGGPAWRRRLVLALEWAYVPAVDLLMHAWVIVLPMRRGERRRDRPRLLAVLLVRGLAFAGLAVVAPRALVLYGVAYLVMVTVLRFADCYQHTYDAFVILERDGIPQDRLRDAAYEQANTYSNLVSTRWPRLNLLLLNFPYHNAHHECPIVPWHRLPALHRELYGSDCAQAIPMRRLLAPFHRYRVARVLAEDYGRVEAGDPAAFKGALAVSFLTAV